MAKLGLGVAILLTVLGGFAAGFGYGQRRPAAHAVIVPVVVQPQVLNSDVSILVGSSGGKVSCFALVDNVSRKWPARPDGRCEIADAFR